MLRREELRPSRHPPAASPTGAGGAARSPFPTPPRSGGSGRPAGPSAGDGGTASVRGGEVAERARAVPDVLHGLVLLPAPWHCLWALRRAGSGDKPHLPLVKLTQGSGRRGTVAVGWAEERSLGVVSFCGQRCQAVAPRLSCVLRTPCPGRARCAGRFGAPRAVLWAQGEAWRPCLQCATCVSVRCWVGEPRCPGAPCLHGTLSRWAASHSLHTTPGAVSLLRLHR